MKSRVTLLIVAVSLAVALGPSSQSYLAQSPAIIEGIVREVSTDKPLGGVSITLSTESPSGFPIGSQTVGSGITDAEGRFNVTTSNIGRYRATPTKEGYVFVREPSVWVEIAAGQRLENLNFLMQREGVISGVVIDEKGNPFPGNDGNVTANVYRYDLAGQKRLGNVFLSDTLVGRGGRPRMIATGSSTRFNDKGEFRLYGLPPGDYYVRVAAGSDATFVPGNKDEANASPVRVESGREVRLGTITLPTPKRTQVTLRVVYQGNPIELGLTQIIAESGDFDILSSPHQSDIPLSLLPGSYDLLILPGHLIDKKYLFGRVSVLVGSDEIQQTVELKPTLRVKTDVSLDGDLLPAPRQSYVSRLVSQFLDGQLSDMIPGFYRIEMRSMPADAYVKSVKSGSRDVLAEGLQLDSDTEIDIELGSKGAILEGTVTDGKGATVANSIVALVPDTPYRQTAPLYRSGSTDINGRFELRGIAPGAYHLFAWSDLPGTAYRNAEFMKAYEKKGKAVRIEKTEKTSVDVRLSDQ